MIPADNREYMMKQIAEIDALICCFQDAYDNRLLPWEIRVTALKFAEVSKTTLRQIKCAHLNKVKTISRDHGGEMEIIRCADCKKMIDVKQL
jgi:hypothetical protein